MQIKTLLACLLVARCCAFCSRALCRHWGNSLFLLATASRHCLFGRASSGKAVRWPRASVHFALQRAATCRTFTAFESASHIIDRPSKCFWAPLQAAACCLPLQGEGPVWPCHSCRDSVYQQQKCCHYSSKLVNSPHVSQAGHCARPPATPAAAAAASSCGHCCSQLGPA